MTTPESLQPNAFGPITPTQMFERTITLLRENFKLFFGIVLIAIGVEVVVGMVLGLSQFGTRLSMSSLDAIAHVLLMLPLVLLGAALIYVFAQIVQGALFYATQAKLIHAPMTVGEACKLAADKVGKIVGISLLVMLRILGYLLLFYTGLIFLVFLAALVLGGLASISGQNLLRSVPAHSIGVYVLMGIFALMFLVLYLVLLLWLVARYAVAIPACLAEDLSVTEAIRRSIQLSMRSKGRLYGLFAVIGAVWVAITLVTIPLQFMAGYEAATRHAISPAMVGFLYLCIAGFRILASAVLVAIVGVAVPLCYYDLRARKEGFGVDLPSASSGSTPAIGSPAPQLQTPDLPSKGFSGS